MTDFEPVVLASGEVTLRDRRSGELLHPGLGPRREAELLYVGQTQLLRRLMEPTSGPLRVLDVGLGAATNALAVIGCAEEVSGRRELVLTSLERDDGALRQALAHPERFPLQARHRGLLEELLERQLVERPGLRWRWLAGDALEALGRLDARQDVVCFDPFSPEVNPALWSVDAFRRFRAVLAPGGVLSTYSASTRTRVTLLLAGFWVGAGAPAAVKKETTVASDGPAALDVPLGARWLQRWRRSSARAPHGVPDLTPELERAVLAHPQFAANRGDSAC
jgi:tRNA U34 5-methylaminomethyl-2-thiouridine-forming methyltransferase MnmC